MTNKNSTNSNSIISYIKLTLLKKYTVIRFSFLFLLLSICGLAFVGHSSNSQAKSENGVDKKEASTDKSIYDKVPIYNSRTIAQMEDAEKPHTLVGAYYNVQDGLKSELLLNNKGSYAIEVQPTLYGAGGAILDVPPVIVEAHSHRFIDIAEWANIGGSGFEQGNIKLFHTGKDLIIGSQIHLTNESKSLGFEYKLGELKKFDSRQLEAVWWNPSNESATDIVLTNASDDLLTVTATLTRKPAKLNTPQEIILQPHETKVLNVRNDLNEGNVFANKKILGLSLTHDGAKDALLAWGMTKDEVLGYSNTAVFKNPNTIQSKQYHGAGLQLGKIGDDKLKPVVVIRNTSNNPTTVKIKVPYTKANGNKKKVKLDSITLAPKEIHKVDMTEVKQLQDVKVAGIEIKYSGRKGSVIASAQSVSHSKTQVFRTLLWDILGHRSATGGYPFYIEGTSSSIAYIKNGTKREQEYVSFLIYGEDQRYMMGLKKIAPNEVVEIDVKKLRDEQIPDENGNTLPIDISEGQIQWTAQPKEENENKAIPDNLGMIGQMIQVDTEKGINSTYFCANCCTGATIGGYVFTNATDFGIGSIAQFIAVKQEDTCYGTSYSFQFNPNSWSSNNSSIATISSLGLATLIGVGTTQITASFQAREVFESPCSGGGDDPPLLRNNSSDKKLKKKRIGTKNIDTKDKEIPTSNAAPCNGCQNFYYPESFNEEVEVEQVRGQFTMTKTSFFPKHTSNDTSSNKATAKVCLTPARANKTVTFKLSYSASDPNLNDGGHHDSHHTGIRPLGTLSSTSGSTGSDGCFSATYRPSHIAGDVKIEAKVPTYDLSADWNLAAGYENFVHLPANITNYGRIGMTLAHPNNFWGKSSITIHGLIAIARSYELKYYGLNSIPTNDKIHYNDISLGYGGKFDLGLRWSNGGSHAEHREGLNVDVRCCTNPGNIPRNRWAELNRIFFRNGSTDTNDETHTRSPHWHLRFSSSNSFGTSNQTSYLTNGFETKPNSFIEVNPTNYRDISGFVTNSWEVLNRQATQKEYEEWFHRLSKAKAKGENQLLLESKIFVRNLFSSKEYIVRSRLEEDFIKDVFWIYLWREPTFRETKFWLNYLSVDSQSNRMLFLDSFEQEIGFQSIVNSFDE